jgi:NADPH2:quinone reductase
MRAIAIERFGGPETLKLLDLPAPEPKAGEVLIQIVASGVNPVDWKIREGYLQKAIPHQFPLIPGWEAAGVIEAVGEGATRFRRGDSVYAYTRLPEVQRGTYAERIALPETMVAAKPKSLLFYEAAAVPLAGLTAWQALFRQPGIGPGTAVLIHAAAGGVGHLAVQFAKNAGATVFGTASKTNQVFIQELGVDHPIDYTTEDFREAVRRVRPAGVDVVLDCVGGDVLRKSFDVITRGGRLVTVTDPPDAAEAERRGIRAYFHFVEPNSEELARIGALADEGKVRPHVSALYPLPDAAKAQIHSREGRTRGKTVLVM